MLDASERRALTLSTFVASCICFAPGQIVSGALLLIASIVLWRWDVRVSARETAAPAGEGSGAPSPAGGEGDQGEHGSGDAA